MGSNDYSRFDMNEYWLTGLGANPGKLLEGPNDGIRVFRRAIPGDHLCDFLEGAGGTVAVLNGSLFDGYAGQSQAQDVSRASLAAWIHAMTGAIFDKDNLFYVGIKDYREPQLPAGAQLRLLEESDAAAFAEFDAACTPDDLDAGFVELDHDMVAGVFVGETLVAKASAYPYFAQEDDEGSEDSPVWDIGYVSRPGERGKGYGKSCCSLLVRELFKLDKIPQIRSQDKHLGSIGIARALGFTQFGAWSYPEEEE